MAGRKPDFRLVCVEEVKGRKAYHRVGAGWKNTNGESESISIDVNAGLPLILQPHTKLVLFENTSQEDDPSFEGQS